MESVDAAQGGHGIAAGGGFGVGEEYDAALPGRRLTELAPGVTVEEVRAVTGAELIVSGDPIVMAL